MPCVLKTHLPNQMLNEEPICMGEAESHLQTPKDRPASVAACIAKVFVLRRTMSSHMQ
jgi:hypothetical protein